jgi:hypothetical protein
MVLQEASLPFLPELPASGLGAMPEGRTAALLVDLHTEESPSGWRLVPNPGMDARRARGLLAGDLDAFEEAADGYTGALKLQALGPWTLAAALELRRGEKALADRGAYRDLADSLAEGVVRHVAEIRKRVPGAGPIVVEFDEHRLPDVIAGRIPTASGWGRIWSVEEPVAESRLAAVLATVAAAGATPGLRLDHPDPPLLLARQAGARFVAFDRTAFESVRPDDLGESLEQGLGLIVGLVPATAGPLPAVEQAVAPLQRFWRILGLPAGNLPAQIAVGVGPGLEDLSIDAAGAALRRAGEVARELGEALES